MKTYRKISLVAVSATLLTLATGSAVEQKVVAIDHGRTVTYALRPVESTPSIAVFAGGRSFGDRVVSRHSDSDKRDTMIQMGRGQTMTTAHSKR